MPLESTVSDSGTVQMCAGGRQLKSVAVDHQPAFEYSVNLSTNCEH